MKKPIHLLLISFLLLITQTSFAQWNEKPSCNTLAREVQKNLTEKSLGNFRISSSFLGSVKAYEYEGDYFVIAEFKEDEYSFSYNKYIFCGVPSSNIFNFNLNKLDSAGKAFHDYIFDYKCDCR